MSHDLEKVIVCPKKYKEKEFFVEILFKTFIFVVSF